MENGDAPLAQDVESIESLADDSCRSHVDEWTALYAELRPPWKERAQLLVDFAAPPPFVKFARAGLSEPRGTGFRPPQRMELLLDGGLLVIALVSAGIVQADATTELVQLAVKLDPAFDARVLHHLTGPHRVWPEEVPEDEMMRALAVLDAIPSIQQRSAMMVQRFMKVSLRRVRSRAMRTIARSMSNDFWLESAYQDSDARVRTNLIEAIYNLGRPISPQFLMLLRRASQDSNHRLKTTALYIMARHGDNGARAQLEILSNAPEGSIRKSAEWALRQLRTSVEVKQAAPYTPQKLIAVPRMTTRSARTKLSTTPWARR